MELKANELRIGNLVSDIHASKSFYAKIIKITEDRIYYGNFHSHPKDLKPIPLTEEWLLKFGFENIRFKYQINNFIIWLDPRSLYYQLYSEGYTSNIKYVHQLQNLYFALNGKELEIKM